MSIKSFFAATPTVIRKNVGDILTATLSAETDQPWHTVGLIVSYPAAILGYDTYTGLQASIMSSITVNPIAGADAHYVAAEIPTGGEPVTSVSIADLKYICTAPGEGYINITSVKPILRTDAGPVVLPEEHQDAAFAVGSEGPAPVYGTVRIKVVIS